MGRRTIQRFYHKTKIFKDHDLCGVDKEKKANIHKLNIDISLLWRLSTFNNLFQPFNNFLIFIFLEN